MKFLCVSAFFETQRQGRWAWPWLLLGIILGIFGLVASDSLYYWILYFLAQYLEIQWIVDFYYTETHTTPPHLILMLLGVGIPFWAAAIVGTLVQGRSVKSLMSPLYGFRWGLVGKSFLVVSLVTALLSVIPGTGSDVPKLEFTGIGKEHIIWMIPVLLCIFIQTSGEDVLFKGYYLRQLGAVTRIFWVAPVLVAAIFVAAHIGNPDVVDKLWILVPVFFINELFIIYLTIRTGGMEIPLVLHWFNNTMIMLFLAERTTQANDLTLWVFDKPLNAADYEASDIEMVITALIFNGFFLLAFCWSRSPFYVPPVTEQEPPTEKGL